MCEHLGSGVALRPDDILEWQDGPVSAALRCSQCDSCALLECLDLDERGQIRVFAMSPLTRAALDLYLRNVAKGSCDPSRAKAEWQALLASAGRPRHLVAYDVGIGRMISIRAFPEGEAAPNGPWPQRIPARDDPRWFTLTGLSKKSGALL
ncbi:MAG TPA: hypothetical protein VMR86_07060 [Myxococcota bacterium]|nr:hypothetical protein [Myxococcota bacterium]